MDHKGQALSVGWRVPQIKHGGETSPDSHTPPIGEEAVARIQMASTDALQLQPRMLAWAPTRNIRLQQD